MSNSNLKVKANNSVKLFLGLRNIFICRIKLCTLIHILYMLSWDFLSQLQDNSLFLLVVVPLSCEKNLVSFTERPFRI